MKQLLVLLICVLSLSVQAQRIELGYHTGSLEIAGDLKSKPSVAAGIHLKHDVSKHFALRYDYTLGNVKNYNNGKQLTYQSVAVQSILYTDINRFKLYGFTGINSFLSRNWTYSDNIGVDVGVGIGYQFNELISLSIEPKLTYTNNDNLDGLISPKYGDVVFYLPIRLGITLRDKSNKDIALQKCLDWCTKEPEVMEIRDTIYDTIYVKTTITNYFTKEVFRDSIVLIDSSVFKIFPVIWFETGEYEVSIDYYDEIAEIAAYMKKYPHRLLYINGHASKTGDKMYNNTLSTNRALAVKEMLVIMYGIESNRLFIQSYGDRVPLARNKDFMNQRVEIHVIH